MKKIIVTMLSVTALLFVTGCDDTKEEQPVTGNSYSVRLADNTVLDADNSYFLITIDNADVVEPLDNMYFESLSEYDKEVVLREREERGVFVKVEGYGLDAETVVLAGDNGTLTDTTQNTLILAKENGNKMQIQVLLKARQAVKAKLVYLTVEKQKMLFNNFNVASARIWTDKDGNEITTINVPDNITNPETQEITQKGIDVISLPVDVSVYTYQTIANGKMVAAGPVKASTAILPNAFTDDNNTKFIFDNYTTADKSLPGCLNIANDTTVACGLNIAGFHSINTEYTLAMETLTTVESANVTAQSPLLIKGIKPVTYEIRPLTSTYINATASHAVFDVKAIGEGNTITADSILVTGVCGTSAGTEAEAVTNGFTKDTTNDSTINACGYVVQQITANSHYRIFMNAKEAADAAADINHLVISVNGENHTYTKSEVMLKDAASAYIGGVPLTQPYKLITSNDTTGNAAADLAVTVNVIPNYFGTDPKIYNYKHNGSAADLFTTETQFTLSSINIPASSNNGLTVVASNCSNAATLDNCYFDVKAAAATSIPSSSPAVVNINYTGTSNVTASQAKFYTTEETTTEPAGQEETGSTETVTTGE